MNKHNLSHATIALIVILLLAVLTINSWAQDNPDGLFYHAAADMTIFEYEVETTPEVNAIPFAFAQEFETVVAAEIVTGHDIVTPRREPTSYWLDNVFYDSGNGTVFIQYASPPERNLLISLFPRDYTGFDYSRVGASAEIIPVQIDGLRGTFEGEYVEGYWGISREEIDSIRSLTGDVSVSAEWYPVSSVRKLRWQQGDWVYEITAWGGDGSFPGRDLMMEDLIALAESMR